MVSRNLRMYFRLKLCRFFALLIKTSLKRLGFISIFVIGSLRIIVRCYCSMISRSSRIMNFSLIFPSSFCSLSLINCNVWKAVLRVPWSVVLVNHWDSHRYFFFNFFWFGSIVFFFLDCHKVWRVSCIRLLMIVSKTPFS